jgi:hypothetical protein
MNSSLVWLLANGDPSKLEDARTLPIWDAVHCIERLLK